MVFLKNDGTDFLNFILVFIQLNKNTPAHQDSAITWEQNSFHLVIGIQQLFEYQSFWKLYAQVISYSLTFDILPKVGLDLGQQQLYFDFIQISIFIKSQIFDILFWIIIIILIVNKAFVVLIVFEDSNEHLGLISDDGIVCNQRLIVLGEHDIIYDVGFVDFRTFDRLCEIVETICEHDF